ncbi:hypothetical protein [Streptomyces sp. AJS327]|uniref:hypothetical protein n=1 Tax=Streptomyces sp. AJS327 TaxID=2545265 RepID=UPI0015DF9E4E|nr:hypothetical protein [Streptomyces sp. AJS327]
MLRTQRRKTVLTAVALMATTALLTSCQSDDDSGGEKSDGGSSQEDAKDTSGGGDGEDKGGGSGDGGDKGDGKGGKGATGTWFGKVSYMAPGKYTVSDQKGTKQAFFTSTSTNIQGSGDICGDENGQAATKCTEGQLEAAAKKGVSAKVEIRSGTALSVIDDR